LRNVLALAEAGVNVLMRAQEQIAHNLANLNTTGYKRRVGDGSQFGGMVASRLPIEDPTQGQLVQTESPFDLAIKGGGSFKIQTPEGIRLTRDGNFTIDRSGMLVTTQGFPVLGTDGPIYIDGGPIKVSPDGTIQSDGTTVGRLDISEGTEGAGTEILSGFLESSNVNPLSEMVRMIESMRLCQMNEKVIKAADELMDKLNTEMGKVR